MSIPLNTFGLGPPTGAVVILTKQPHDIRPSSAQKGTADAAGYQDGLEDIEVIYKGGMLSAGEHAEITAVYQASKTTAGGYTGNFMVKVQYWHVVEKTIKTQIGMMEMPGHQDLGYQLVIGTRFFIRRLRAP